MAIPQTLLEGIDKLEPLPVTARKLTAALTDQRISAGEVAKIVEHDQAMASNILRLANSALFAARMPVESVRDAVVRLGAANLLTLLLEKHFRHLTQDSALYDLRENDQWLHSAAASHAGQEILRQFPKAGIPRVLPVAALLHDIGKLVMTRYLKADASQILALAKQKKVTFVQAEHEVLGCDHAEVGAALARAWNFPEEITDAIAFHHHIPEGRSTPLVDAVVLANLAAKECGTGLGAEGLNLEIDAGIRKRLGVEFADFARLVAATSVKVSELRREHKLVP
ncbi:MAG: HDOD domain-containing protein [Myxococcales bacterium]